MKINFKKLLFVFGVLLSVVLFFYFGGHHYLNFEAIKSRQAELNAYYNSNPILVISIFFICYTFMTAVSLPGAAVFSVAAGAVFGLFLGSVIVSFSSTIGASLAFLSSRYLFRDFVTNKYKKFVEKVNKGVEREGSYYLFTLRLIPVFPFFVINLVMGLTNMPLKKYYWVSQLGMLPATIVYVNAGLALSTLESLSEIAKPQIIISLSLLGLMPIIIKKVLGFFKKDTTKAAA